VSDDRDLLVQLDARQFGVEVAKFMASRFNAAGHPVICIDRNQLRSVTHGLTEAHKLYVSFRIDLSSARVASDPTAVVGTVSTHYQRAESRLLSWVPMTQFIAEGDWSALTGRAQQALLEQAQKSVVDQIVYLKKRGF
jgi:hypothetical protein